jgi:hypothetical protein
MGSLDFRLPIINGTGNIHFSQKNYGGDSIKKSQISPQIRSHTKIVSGS